VSKAPEKSVRAEPKRGRRTAKSSGPGPDELARIALDLFAKRHFASVTIKDIGRAANVNSAMIYYHYKDKSDLFRAAVETAVQDAFNLYAKHCYRSHESAADSISSWFDVHVTLHRQLRNVIKISLDYSGIGEVNRSIDRFYQHENEILQRIVSEGIEAGIFKQSVKPSEVATMISTSLDGILARSMILKDFDMVGTVECFKKALWLYLGYEPAKNKQPRPQSRDRKIKSHAEH